MFVQTFMRMARWSSTSTSVTTRSRTLLNAALFSLCFSVADVHECEQLVSQRTSGSSISAPLSVPCGWRRDTRTR